MAFVFASLGYYGRCRCTVITEIAVDNAWSMHVCCSVDTIKIFEMPSSSFLHTFSQLKWFNVQFRASNYCRFVCAVEKHAKKNVARTLYEFKSNHFHFLTGKSSSFQAIVTVIVLVGSWNLSAVLFLRIPARFFPLDMLYCFRIWTCWYVYTAFASKDIMKLDTVI